MPALAKTRHQEGYVILCEDYYGTEEAVRKWAFLSYPDRPEWEQYAREQAKQDDPLISAIRLELQKLF